MESEGDKGLPEELMTTILVRLPLKNVLQCKCVSKYWLSLISSPQFAKIHFSAKDHRLLLVCPKKFKYCPVTSLFDEPLIDPFYLENPDPFVRMLGSVYNRPSIEAFDLVHPQPRGNPHPLISGSVNGLICLCNRVEGVEGVILWNPTTRKVKHLPDIDRHCHFYMYGFGYDEVHDDYKVIAIDNNSPGIGLIYSLKSDSWKKFDIFKCWVKYVMSAKLVNGKVHWVTGTTCISGWGIMAIDLVDETSGKVELPNYEEGEKEVDLGVLGSDLSMLCSHITNHQRTQIDLWIMKEYGVKESWTKLYSIECQPDSGCYLTAPLYMSNTGESLFVSGSYVMIYSPEKKSIRYPEIINAEGCFKAELYMESLVCPILQNEPMT